MKQRKNLKLLMASAALALLPQFAMSQTIVSVPYAEPTVFDPVTAVAAVTQEHAYLIYDTLFSQDSAGQPQPQMVETVETSEDGRTLTMSLRDGLMFHDGSDVTAVDAVASISRWAKKDLLGKTLISMGMVLEVVDDKTFTVTTDEPTPMVLDGFSKPTSSALFVMRAADAAQEPSEPVTANIGSGPFIFVQDEYVAGSKLVYEKNPDYVPRDEPIDGMAGGKVVNIDRLEFHIIKDAATAAAAISTGSIDVYEDVPLDLMELFAVNEAVDTRLKNSQGSIGVFRPNFLHPPLDNMKVRQAIMTAFDQEEFMTIASGGIRENWDYCYSFLACNSNASPTNGTDTYREGSIEAAKALLAESGYDETPLHILLPTDWAPMNAFTEVAAARLEMIGLNVHLEPMSKAALLQRRSNKGSFEEGGWDAFVSYGFGTEMGNPATNFAINSSCENAWFGWPCDEETEELRNRWMYETDETARREILEALQARLAEYLPYMPLGKFLNVMAYRTNIEGLQSTPVPVYWGVSKTE